MGRRPKICITPGDPRGVGIEILEKSESFLKSLPADFFLFGATKRFHVHGSNLHLMEEPSVPNGIDPDDYLPSWAIEASAKFILQKSADALVTGPISKTALHRAGYPFQGHTDFLAHLSGASSVTMMLANEKLRASLVTTHIPLKEVPTAITFESLERTINHTIHALTHLWKEESPIIKVLALNPHAGEGGLLGQEEKEWMNAAVQTLAKRAAPNVSLIGPVPADTFFLGPEANAIIALYHDQGLIPVKLLDFKNTINITLGLPFIRTSVDHGTATDIVGKGIADPSSFQQATKQAFEWAQRSA